LVMCAQGHMTCPVDTHKMILKEEKKRAKTLFQT